MEELLSADSRSTARDAGEDGAWEGDSVGRVYGTAIAL